MSSVVTIACAIAALCLIVVIVVLVGVRSVPRKAPPSGRTQKERDATGLGALTDPKGASVAPGILWDAVSVASPYLLLEAYIDGVFCRVRASTTFAGLYVPGRVGDTVAFELVVAALESSCSSSRARYSGQRATFGPVVVTAPNTKTADVGDGPVVGLAPVRRNGSDGRYVSPVLQVLFALRQPVAWALNVAHRPQTYLSLTVPDAPCFSWCWSPMDTSGGLYVVPLLPSNDAPWASVVLDLGNWQSVLPSRMRTRSRSRSQTAAVPSTRPDAQGTQSTEDDNASVLLTTVTGCTFFIRPGTYRIDFTTNARCVLGISAGLDVTNSRLGYVPVTPVTVL